jgi:hypothetical protein
MPSLTKPYDSASQALMPVIAEELADTDFTKSATDGFSLKFDPSSSISVTRSLAGIKLTPAPAVDFWRSGAGGTTLPDGTTDLTESIRRNGSVGINVDPGYTLDVNGSFGTNIVNVPDATYNMTANDHTVVLTATTTQAVLLPSIGQTRRIVAVVNATNVAKTFTPPRLYQNLTGGFTDVIPANSSMILQSNGAGWVLLSQSTLDATPSDFWRSGAGGTTLPDGATDLTESIRRNGRVGIDVDPATTLDVNGSFGTNIVNAPDPTYTFASNDHTVVLTATTSQTVTLPGVVSPRREVAVVNATNVAKTFGPARRYRDLSGNIADVIPANSSMILHNNGGEWMLLSLSTLDGTRDFWRSGTTGTVLPDGTTDTTEFVSRAGDVAIGTTNVAGRLTVNGGDQLGGNINPAANLVSLHLTSGNGVVGSGGSLVFGANSGAWNFAGIKGVLSNGTGAMGHLAFSTRRTATDANLTEAMRITDAGRVGIGTAAPSTTLHVNSATANDSGLRLERLTNASPATTGAATLGVDATGKVVVAANQFVNFASPSVAAVTPAGTSAANASDYISITVPSAGTWEIDFSVRGANLLANSGITAVLTDSANATVSRPVLCIYSQTANNVQGTGTGKARVITTGAQTFKVRVFSLNVASGGQATSNFAGESWATATQIR